VRTFCASGLPPAHKARADLLARTKRHMQDWYANWTQGVLDAPFYRVNSRT